MYILLWIASMACAFGYGVYCHDRLFDGWASFVGALEKFGKGF